MSGLRIIISIFVAVCCVQESYCATASDIANYAKSQLRSDVWLFTSDHGPGGVDTNKCNIFVADVLKHEGAPAPNRHFWYSPIGANEWADPSSSYLTKDHCWERCSSPSTGDVIAIDGGSYSGHVGIVTGSHKTTSASAAASPQGLIVENDWGFRSGQDPTCWRFKYSLC